MYEIDTIDYKILQLLQQDGRLTNAEIATKVHVSPATCHRRTQRLFDEGIITSVKAHINPRAVGRDSMIIIGVVLKESTPENFTEFEQAIHKFPFILSCYCVAGNFDYFLQIRVKDTSEFNKLHRGKILTLPNVSHLRSFFVLSEVLENAPLKF